MGLRVDIVRTYFYFSLICLLNCFAFLFVKSRAIHVLDLLIDAGYVHEDREAGEKAAEAVGETQFIETLTFPFFLF
jgi:hypothetical protein